MNKLRELPKEFSDETRIRFGLSYIPEPNSGCWLWTGHSPGAGYGRFSINGIGYSAHRIAVAMRGIPVSPELYCDHKCRTRACVNPDHLRLVVPRINSIENSVGPTAENCMKTSCKHGHVFTPETTIYKAVGQFTHRRCLICQRLCDKIYQRKRRKALLDGRTKP